MRAAWIDRYEKDVAAAIGGVKVGEVDTPAAGDDEVMVRVKAAAVNPLDILTITGGVKLIQDYSMPLVLGNEFSGYVEKVGNSVTGFRPGDRVYARTPIDRAGAFAEYMVLPESALAAMPKGYDFAEAVAIPLTGLTAWQALKEELRATPGQSVLIPGGSGSFGRMAVPIAKDLGLTVTVAGNARSREEILGLGADRYLDYRKENYWESGIEVDYVIDALGPNEFDHELSVLKAGGTLLGLRGVPNKVFAEQMGMPLLKRVLFSLAGSKLDGMACKQGKNYRFMFVRADGGQLCHITEIMEQHNVHSAIDPHKFHLDDARDALGLVASGHPAGKVVIRF